MGGWQHGFASFWWIFPIFILVMIIACIFMMRGCSCMSGWHHPGERVRRVSTDSAEEILNKRYALGEIDQKEYEEKKVGIIRKEERPDG
jgi:uncharacterized membrane protein